MGGAAWGVAKVENRAAMNLLASEKAILDFLTLPLPLSRDHHRHPRHPPHPLHEQVAALPALNIYW